MFNYNLNFTAISAIIEVSTLCHEGMFILYECFERDQQIANLKHPSGAARTDPGFIQIFRPFLRSFIRRSKSAKFGLWGALLSKRSNIPTIWNPLWERQWSTYPSQIWRRSLDARPNSCQNCTSNSASGVESRRQISHFHPLPFVKITRERGKMSEWIFQVQPRNKPLATFSGALLRGLGEWWSKRS